MQRKSSIHFAPVTNIKFAVSHSERTELSEPGYLLPKEHQLPNIVVAGSLSETDLAELFIKQKESMTGQAKARGSSPFWEGVVVLKNTDGQEQSEYLKAWKVAYEKATGHQVLHMSIHLDEGYIDTAGAVHYNPHAHVIVSRMNEKNRVIALKRRQLGEVQDLTAEILQMERGSTLEERGGKRGRAHIGHKEFRLMADEARLNLEKPKADLARLQALSKELSDANLSKIKDLQAKLDGEPARQAAALAAQKLQLDEQYRLDREALKASGEATQRDYQALKKAHEKALADLATAQAEAAKVPGLVAQVGAIEAQATTARQGRDEAMGKVAQQATEIERLKAEYAAERAALKASGEATQRDYQQLKQQHEAALGKLATAQTEAGKVPELVAQVNALKPKADRVPDLERDLAKAQQQAEKVPDLVEQVKASQEQATQKTQEIGQISTDLATAQERYKNLRTKALAIQEQRNDLAKKVDTMTQENQRLQTENERLAERREAASRITLQTLKADFGVDIAPAEKLKGEALEKWREAAEDKVFEQQLAEMKPPAPAKRPVEAQKRPVEAPKLSKAPSPSPIQEKTLVERLAASLAAMLEWLKAIGGVQEPVGPSTLHIGPVKHADDLHCVQKTGRRYAVHQLADLDAIPALDDPNMSIQYRDGKGHVSGRTVPGLQR